VPETAVSLAIDAQALRPLIAEVLAALESERSRLPGDRLAFSEAEAARMLGLHVHQLRDARLRHEIEASVGPGKKILYRREDLLAYLASRRWAVNGHAAAHAP
jgi:hypothetical protein